MDAEHDRPDLTQAQRAKMARLCDQLADSTVIAIDTEFIRENFPQKYAQKDQDGILNPDHIADAYWMLHQQPRDAWTHELDLRPYMERF